MIVNLDLVAMHQTVRIGGDLFTKVAPMICANVATGQLLYDARLIPQFANDKPPMVEWPV